MQSKNHPPNALQRKWQAAVREVGCPATLSLQVQVHHLEGAAFRINKIHVGQWLTVAIHWELHDPNANHPRHITKHPTAFRAMYGSEYDLLRRQREMVERRYPNADFLIPESVMRLAEEHYKQHENTEDQWIKALCG